MTRQQSNDPGPTRDGALILIVDDSDALREALVAALLSFGYSVLAFESGRGLLEAIGQLAPACIILDFDLPDLTGLEIQQRLLQGGETTPLIFLSASIDPRVSQRAMEAGAAGYLAKPAHVEELDALIVAALGHRAPDGGA